MDWQFADQAPPADHGLPLLLATNDERVVLGHCRRQVLDGSLVYTDVSGMPFSAGFITNWATFELPNHSRRLVTLTTADIEAVADQVAPYITGPRYRVLSADPTPVAERLASAQQRLQAVQEYAELPLPEQLIEYVDFPFYHVNRAFDVVRSVSLVPGSASERTDLLAVSLAVYTRMLLKLCYVNLYKQAELDPACYTANQALRTMIAAQGRLPSALTRFHDDFMELVLQGTEPPGRNAQLLELHRAMLTPARCSLQATTTAIGQLTAWTISMVSLFCRDDHTPHPEHQKLRWYIDAGFRLVSIIRARVKRPTADAGTLQQLRDLARTTTLLFVLARGIQEQTGEFTPGDQHAVREDLLVLVNTQPFSAGLQSDQLDFTAATSQLLTGWTTLLLHLCDRRVAEPTARLVSPTAEWSRMLACVSRSIERHTGQPRQQIRTQPAALTTGPAVAHVSGPRLRRLLATEDPTLTTTEEETE